MKNLKRIGGKVVFGPVRLNYVHLFEKYAFEGEDKESAKYMCSVLIPMKEKAALKAIEEAIEAVTAEAVSTKWRGVRPKRLATPLRDGNEKEGAGDEYTDVMYFNAKSSRRVAVVDRDCEPLTDPESMYSGVWANVSVSFFAYDVSGNKGIGVALNSVQKVRDDEPFGGSTDGSRDFDDFGGADDDDDL